MVRTTSLILALLTASSAAAQTTRCGPEFGQWVCHTEQPRDRPNIYESSRDTMKSNRDAFDAAYERQQRFQQDAVAQQRARAEAGRRAYEAQQQTDRRMLEEQVTKFVSEGRCDDAKATALRGGDMTLAEQAMRLCSAAP